MSMNSIVPALVLVLACFFLAESVSGQVYAQGDSTGATYVSDGGMTSSCQNCTSEEGAFSGGGCSGCMAGNNRAGGAMRDATCGMPQHHAYFPPMHGYYYFRPHHHSHLSELQRLVGSWGGDPQNPFSNRIFQDIYAEYRAENTPSKLAPLPPEDAGYSKIPKQLPVE